MTQTNGSPGFPRRFTQWYPHGRVKQCKCKSDQQAHLGIAQVEIMPYRPDHQVQYQPVNKGKRVTNHQYRYHVPGIDRF